MRRLPGNGARTYPGCGTLDESLNMKGFLDPRYAGLPRQAIPTYYRLNGAIYIWETKSLWLGNRLYDSGCYAYVMRQEDSVDIDTEMDFYVAEAIFRSRKEK